MRQKVSRKQQSRREQSATQVAGLRPNRSGLDLLLLAATNHEKGPESAKEREEGMLDIRFEQGKRTLMADPTERREWIENSRYDSD